MNNEMPISNAQELVIKMTFRDSSAKGSCRLQNVSGKAEETGKTGSRASDSAVGSTGELGWRRGWGDGANGDNSRWSWGGNHCRVNEGWGGCRAVAKG